MIVDLGGIVRIYNCPSPYVIDGPVGEAQSVSGATLGWSSGTTGFYMSRDGTKLVGSGNNGDSTYSVKIFELATPFVITTGRTLLSTYTYTGDTNAPNGSMSQTQLSADGLTLIFSYSTAEMKLGTMTVPFDVTTMTFSVNRNIQTDMTGNPWQVGHITPDGNSLYVYTDNATQGRVGKYTKDVLNPALQDSTFVVGDPTTATRIDGTATNITSVATDIDGTLNVDGLATFQADVTISDDLTITSNTTDQFRIETATDVAPETPVEAAITIERTGTTVDSVEMPRVIAGDPGTESSGIIVNGGTYQSVIKASDIGGTNAAQFIIHRHSTTLPAAIVGSRSKDDTSAHTIVADNDVLFGLYAAGWDGVDSYSLSSAIEFEIDGTPGQNDMPGQITFFTSADGTELLVERMRIRSTGDVEIDNDLTVAGDFTVSGTLTSINTSDLNVADNIIILNSGETGAPTLDAGIEIERGTSDNVLFRWNETSDVWEFTNDGTTYFPVVTEHTGEVTGSTALTLDVTAVTNRTDVVAEAADDVAIHDDTDGTLKKVNLSSITDGGFF
jgi:hypothetical protein